MIRVVGAVIAMCFVAALAAGCKGPVDAQRAIAKAQEYREKGNKKAAIIEVKNVLQSNPNHAEARYLLGVTYYEIGDYRLAEHELRRALDLSFERSRVMPVLGKAMLMLGDFQKILDQVQVEVHASNEVQADILTVRARALMGLGRVSQAREVLDAALAKQPEFADALVEQARLAGAEQKLDEAARLIERAIVSVPQHVEAWLIRGELARVGADQAGVVVANQKVLEFDPANTKARLNIASLHIANNRLDEAHKLIAQTRALDPGSIVAIQMQALVDYRARDFKKANDTIQQVLKVAPEYMPGILLAGAILTELGSHEQAQAHIGRVLERVPGNLYARKLLISTLARSGQMQRAMEVLQTGLKQAPADNELQTLAGELYLQSGEFGTAAQYFDAAAKRDPKNAAARTQLGISRMASGETDRAFADLESAVQLDSAKYQTDIVLIVSYLRHGSYDQALKAMESLERKQPNNPMTFNLKAAIYLGKKDIPSARKNFERALELQPTFFAAAINLAQLDLQEKNPKGARGRIEAMLEKDKGNAQILIALAELGPALGATQKEQVDWFERARKASPHKIQPPMMLARLYLKMGDAKKALEIARQAQATSPENPQFLDLLGTVQISAGEISQALETYRNLVKLQPKSAVALYGLANAQAGAGQLDVAKGTLRQVLSLAPDSIDALGALIILEIRAKRYLEAIEITREIQKRKPKASIGFVLEGDVLMAEKKFPQAIRAYEVAQGISKTFSTLVKLHMAYISAGKMGEGDARLAQWFKESPEDAQIRFYIANVAINRGDYKQAITHYEWLQQKQPDNVLVVNNLAWAYFQVKDVRALETAERAYKLAPDDPSIVDTLGTLLIEAGNLKRGIELLERAAKAAPMIPAIGYHLAQGWLRMGDKAKARSELERIMATNLSFPEKPEALKLLEQLRN